MILHMKQKVFSWTEKFTIKDALDNDRYYVEGELFSWGHKLHVINLANQEVAFIKQVILTFLPKFEVYIDDRLVVEVKKELTFFRPKYSLEGTDWTVDGDFWGHNYDISCPSGILASISKAYFTWGDSYQMDIADGSDEILVIATILAIDCVLSSQQSSAAASSSMT